MKDSVKSIRIILIVLAVQILAVAGIVMMPMKQKQEPFSMELRGEEGTALFHLISQSETEGVKEYTKEFPLEKGDYNFEVKYSCSSPNNLISIVPDSLKDEHVGRSNWTIPDPKTDHTEIAISLAHDVPDVKLAVYSQDTEGLTVESIKITRTDDLISPLAVKTARIVTWVFFCFLADTFLFLMMRYPAKRKHYIILLIASIVMSLSMIWPTEYLPGGEDLFFHINRIYGIRDGLLRGIPWVKLQQNWYNGYGYAVGVFYGDALLYFPAVFNIAGIDIHSAFKLFVFLIDLLTVFSAYYCFGRMYDEKIGCCSAVVYGFLLFRWIDLYHRAAIGEFCAMAFLPFLLYAIYLLWNDNFSRSRLMFVIGFSGLLQTHLITCELAILMVFALLVGNPRRTFTKRRIISLTTSAVWVVLVNLAFLVPFLDFSSLCRIAVMNSSEKNRELFLNQKISFELYQLITIANAQMIIVFILGAIRKLMSIYKKEKKSESWIPMNLLLILAALFILAGTSIFPWEQVIKIGFLTLPVTSIQFAWRFLVISGLFATLIVCELLSRSSVKKKNHKLAGMCLLIAMLLPGLIYSFAGMSNRYYSRLSFESGSQMSIWCSLDEYLITGTDRSDLAPDYSVTGDVNIISYSKDGTSVRFTYETNEGGTIDLPVFNYPYYRAETDSAQMIPVEDGNNHRIRLSLPQDSGGTVHLYFKTPLLWILALIASVASVLILAGMNIYKNRKKSGTGEKPAKTVPVSPRDLIRGNME